MRNQRSYSLEFKCQIVQELLSGAGSAAQLCCYNIGSSLLYYWKKQYNRGKFNSELTAESALKDRVEQLERLAGKLALEVEFLKRGVTE
jgi:transposase-like protein